MTHENLPATDAENEEENKDPAQQDYDKGRECLNNKEIAQAANLFHNALRGFEESGNVNGIANAADKLGDICLDRGELEKSLSHFQRAYEICAKEGDEFSLMSLNKKIARAQKGLNNFGAAVDIYLDLLETYRKLNNPGKAVETLETLAEIYQEMNERDKAVDALQAAAGIHKSYNHPKHAQDLLDRAEAVAQQGS